MAFSASSHVMRNGDPSVLLIVRVLGVPFGSVRFCPIKKIYMVEKSSTAAIEAC